MGKKTPLKDSYPSEGKEKNPFNKKAHHVNAKYKEEICKHLVTDILGKLT